MGRFSLTQLSIKPTPSQYHMKEMSRTGEDDEDDEDDGRSHTNTLIFDPFIEIESTNFTRSIYLP